MKLATYRYQGRTSFGIVDRNDVVIVADDLPGNGMIEALATGAKLGAAALDGARTPLSEIEYLPPISVPPRTFCVGRNFKRAMARAGLDFPAYPILFTRFPASCVGHLAPVVRPRVSEQLDYEGEVAVVIGRAGRHIDVADALGFVAGYTCYNDGSIRDYQRHTTQDTPGKNFWRSGAAGPWLVTADELPDPRMLAITTRLNGMVVQQDTLDDLLFSVPEVIAYLSRISPLQPGDMIALGTPFGAGVNQQPPRWLVPGDEVSVTVNGIGTLTNRVVDEQDASA